ncbi:MAG: FAD-dependent oxidoreductase [Verrucomicrobia bacterium]|nr:FAD-dependent oxidoreductase [Verrucomicrobiota bacterium]MCH8512711.1 FAD-dependent oxidoreductase [Kiritimatiellia bacterium]
MTSPCTHNFSRAIPVESGYDLVVAGGGPGGCGAAISAARKGARVLLVEATGTLGGMGTSAMVSAWSHMANGKHSVIGGLMLELVETLYARGGIAPSYDPAFWNTIHNRGLGYNTEAYKRLLDELCEAAGVEVRFFAKVIEAEADPTRKEVHGLILHQVEGMRFVEAKTFVDATGDAILADLCGVVSRRAGRDTPHIMPPTLCSALAGIDYERFHRKHQQEAVERALADGYFSQPDRHVPGLFRTGKTTAILNAGHLFNMDALDTVSLSEGMRNGRLLAREYTEFFKQYLEGCEEIEIVTSAPAMGVRESRRIVGEYELDYEDYQARRHFPDQIAIYCKQPDVHVYDTSPEEYARYHREFESMDVLQPGESYGIPYGVLVPKGWRNLWVAGRCCASDLKVNGAIRDQPACVMMGQAAGTAAVQAIRRKQSAAEIDTRELIETLRADGANLPQRETATTLTRKEVRSDECAIVPTLVGSP